MISTLTMRSPLSRGICVTRYLPTDSANLYLEYNCKLGVCSLGANMRGLPSLCWIMLSLIAPMSAWGRVEIETGSDPRIEISGTITEADAARVQQAASQLERTGGTFVLNSEGGDVFAAMTIGRIVRRSLGTTSILYAKCYSSCALIYIAGVQRVNGGELGLHRPFFAANPQSPDDLEKQVPLMLAKVKAYVAEMGITEDFYFKMVNTPPSRMAIYRGRESRQLVPEDDPIFDEIYTSRMARAYGVSTIEMRRLQQEADSKCGTIGSASDFNRTWTCQEAVKWRLSQSAYVERDARAKSTCWQSDKNMLSASDRAAMDNMPMKTRLDYPPFLHAETCVRNVMQGR